MDDVTAAKHLVRLLDLTSLNNDDTESRTLLPPNTSSACSTSRR